MTASSLVLDAPVAVRLADWGVIRAKGEDAASFLNGQLTQETVRLEPGRARLAGYCSPKGRLLASFVVWRVAADEFLLACSADLLAPTLKRLSMYVLRARCKLGDASSELALWGVALPGIPDGVDSPRSADDRGPPPEGAGGLAPERPSAAAAAAGPAIPAAPYETVATGDGTSIRLADAGGAARVLWVGPAHAVPPWPTSGEAAVWDWLEVQSGVPRVVASTVEAFVPQMINLELVGGVDFQKGCYPGQEIVARSQYRGTLKRRMYLAEGEAGASAGAEIFAAADPSQPAGQIVLAASLPAAGGGARHAALVEMKRALTEDGGELRVGAADGPALRLRELPYAVPADGQE